MHQPKKQWTFWTFGMLARLGRQILAIPASSERVFSSAGNICTVRRTNLSVSKMEQLVFMKENSKLLDEISDLKWPGYF